MNIKVFRGLNNTQDPLRTGPDWLSTAENIDITNTGGIKKREGYTSISVTPIASMYTTLDFQRMYASRNGAIQAFDGTTFITIAPLTSTAPVSWAEMNGSVYYSNGTDSGIIRPDNQWAIWAWPEHELLASGTVLNPKLKTRETDASGKVREKGQPGGGGLPHNVTVAHCFTYILPDGRETGPSQVTATDVAFDNTTVRLMIRRNGIPATPPYRVQFYATDRGGEELQRVDGDVAYAEIMYKGGPLLTEGCFPLPAECSVIQSWRGKMYAAQYMPVQNQTVVWYSQPFATHLFLLATDFFVLPGEVRMMAPTDDALIIGTDEIIYAFGERLDELAGYGVPKGAHWAYDNKRVLFWSNRGVCQAAPFKNLTEELVSVPPGLSACGAVISRGGQQRYLAVVNQGGTSAFNSIV